MTVLAPSARTRRWLFYGWYIALAGAGTNFLIGGIVNFGFGVFIDPIREELGWQPSLDFQETLAATIDWYLDNPGWWKAIREESAQFTEYYERQYGWRLATASRG